MEEIAGRIELYHNLFTGCLAISLICLILAAVLFFVLDMKEVLGYLSGRQRRKRVKEMEAANAVSGRLMRERSSMRHVPPEMKMDRGIRQAPVFPMEETPTSLLQEDGSTAPLNKKAAGGRFLIEREIILIHTEEVI